MATRQAGLESGWISLPVVRPSRWMWRAGLSDSLPKATIRTLCADLAARDGYSASLLDRIAGAPHTCDRQGRSGRG